jgi:hypothetical protein
LFDRESSQFHTALEQNSTILVYYKILHKLQLFQPLNNFLLVYYKIPCDTGGEPKLCDSTSNTKAIQILRQRLYTQAATSNTPNNLKAMTSTIQAITKQIKKAGAKNSTTLKKVSKNFSGEFRAKPTGSASRAPTRSTASPVSRAQMEVEKAVAAAATDKNIRRFLVRPCRDWMTGADVVAMMNRIEVMAAAAMGKKSSK